MWHNINIALDKSVHQLCISLKMFIFLSFLTLNPTISKTAFPNELVTRLHFSCPNKVSYNICIWKMRIKNVGVVWQNIKLHLFPGRSFYVISTWPSKWVSILDWSHAGADSSHTQIYFSIITAFYLLSRVLGTAGNDLYSAMIFRQNRPDDGKLNHFTCPYPLRRFVPVSKYMGVKAVLAIQTVFYDVCKRPSWRFSKRI